MEFRNMWLENDRSMPLGEIKLLCFVKVDEWLNYAYYVWNMHEMIDMCMNLIGFMLMNDPCDIVKHVKDINKVFP